MNRGLSNQKEYHRNYYQNKIKKLNDNDYINEFIRITNLGGKYLTTKGFNEVSKITSYAVIKGLHTNWKSLLIKYNKLEELFSYVVNEYIEHAYSNGKANSTKFVQEHPYIGQYIFSDVIDIKKVRIAGGFINKYYDGQYNDYLLKQHFKKVRERLGRIPSITEFLKYGEILPSIYCDYYGIQRQIWDKVLEIMISDKEELNHYLKSRDANYKNMAIKYLKEYKSANKIPDYVLKTEFDRVFNYFLQQYGTHPTRRLFNEYSVFNDLTYRKRYKIRWSDVARMYGYTLKERNVSEKIFLEILRKLLKTDYERGKTWDWLKGVKGKNLYCDGYFPQYNLVVELDGKHHRTPVPNFGGYERFIRDKENDKIKEKLIRERNILFLRISSKEKWQDEEYLKIRLQSIGISIK